MVGVGLDDLGSFPTLMIKCLFGFELMSTSLKSFIFLLYALHLRFAL